MATGPVLVAFNSDTKGLILQIPMVTLHTTKFNIQKHYILPTGCIYVFYGYQNKEQLFPYAALSDWLL